ncbi:MAG: prephenate dehydrogenase/arogenate dehydrogenase family protein [Acidobacteria bacterium]|nr:prephenate dehydrogenase/arogenate dehydrogenase family protein [Acidobacteriota bacterium]MBI3278695.1 prephenate dehydrogenase/arogenate dehydrogenase family protein [Acidobacteriota bacterium]
MRCVAIAGVGLIGGSFALALRKAGFGGRILGVSSPATLERARALGVIDEAADLAQAAAEADLIYLSQPISRILQTIRDLTGMIRPGCMVTDAGSTKAQIVDEATRCLPVGQFLGGHPMAGKEARGVEAADPELFRNLPYVFAPASPELLGTRPAKDLVDWVRSFGAIPVVVSPPEHDRAVAFTSHLPQLASSALAVALSEEEPLNQLLRTSGPGLHDMTRLALSPYDVWRDILATNASNVDQALSLYIDKLLEFRENLTTSKLEDQFSVAEQVAKRVRRRTA